MHPKQITPQDFAPVFALRKKEAHKGDFGHVLVIAGHGGVIGAGFLSSMGSLRVGAGMATYALPQSAFDKFDPHSPEVMCVGVSDEGTGVFSQTSLADVSKLLDRKQTVVIGPGLGTEAATKDFLKRLLPQVTIPVVLDADGLNCIADDVTILSQIKAPTLITPHPGEMARLCGCSRDEVQAQRSTLAAAFAKKYGVIVVLKGHDSIVASAEGETYVNPTGNPGMATAGTGDVLAGVIGGLLAQGIAPFTAALGGVYLHGLAGDLAAQKGERGFIASDLLVNVPAAMTKAFSEVGRE
ncbi:MAG: NAD(P)H-hydrate dehydratase [Deltaproteobacteria bacterium]|nr:NAD(P)H-hydrate dehydratase [Deltaproteobacteria bacterium]